MIDPAFWKSERVASLSIEHRYLFIGLIANADDQGRMKAHPALIRSAVYAYDDIQLETIEAGLQAIAQQGGIILYAAEGTQYLQIRKWWTYQNPRWAWPSDYPPPDGWQDRLRYRRGNEVVTVNWDSPDSEPNPAPPPVEGDLSADPERDQSGTTVEPAPSTSGSGRTSDSGRPESGPDGPVPALPGTFRDWQSLLEQAERAQDRYAILRRMFELYFPGRKAPDYGRFGRAAKQAGGAAVLASWLFKSSTDPPKGDILAYCVRCAQRAAGREGSDGRAAQSHRDLQGDIDTLMDAMSQHGKLWSPEFDDPFLQAVTDQLDWFELGSMYENAARNAVKDAWFKAREKA
jgi:hypothetical protein